MSVLQQLLQALQTLGTTDKAMPLYRARLILEIVTADTDEFKQRDMADKLDISPAAVSRNLDILLIEYDDKGTIKPGYDIIERFEITDGRMRGIRLTLNGRRLRNQLIADLSRKPR